MMKSNQVISISKSISTVQPKILTGFEDRSDFLELFIMRKSVPPLACFSHRTHIVSKCYISFSSELIPTMAETFKIFCTVEKLYNLSGVSTGKSNQKCQIFVKRALLMQSMAFCGIASLAFLVYEAKIMQEYSLCFYIITTMFGCNYFYVITVWKMPMIESLIEKFGQFFRASKLSYRNCGFGQKFAIAMMF